MGRAERRSSPDQPRGEVVALMSTTLSSGGEGELADDLSPMIQDEEVTLPWEDGQ
jgi:hypothetical protein